MSATFDSLLIANRGEIVARIARSARRLGLRTIAVESDADRGGPHGRHCDAAVAIGGVRAADSYLRGERLIAAAVEAGAQALHPGYGFLSENAAFAQAVQDAGLVWIGPPPNAMRAMADKASARRRMAAAGVPVLPGYDGDAQERETLANEARRIGFPLMVKARAGGGGRGMRLVRDTGELEAALDAAAAEAQAAFGDARLLLERALVAPRHVEIQVFADAHGTVLQMGERDCSVQRRHQKIVEEAPSPAVDATLRRAMGAVAVRVAREIGYVGAGTVEFLLDGDGAYWFMEMNTRLQVEHPLTEALLGLDLVEWQLRVARGEPLPWTQEELLARYERGGHAIEVRLCAEDPAQDFLPQSGRLLRWQPPAGLRCEHALEDGCDIGPHYDSMLAKLIAHADDRTTAVERLAGGLDQTVCLGPATNRGFLARVLRHRAFIEGQASTAFIGEHFPDNAARRTEAPSALCAWAAAAIATLPDTTLPPLWRGWTSSGRMPADAPIAVEGLLQRWRVDGSADDLTLRCGDLTHRIASLRRDADGRVLALVDGRPRSAAVVRSGTRWCWLADGIELEVHDRRHARPLAAAEAAGSALRAPMHGRVTQLLVEAGASVEAGALLIVMEAMKMEHRIVAAHAGRVAGLHVAVGAQVAARQLLVEIER